MSSLLYQPPVLRPIEGQEIRTLDGIYRPLAGDTWHSDARFRQLEQEVLDLRAAVARLRP